MDESKIAIINELYHKAKNEGLTEEETLLQKQLREEYIQTIRANMRGTLNNISLLNPDGSVTELGKKDQ